MLAEERRYRIVERLQERQGNAVSVAELSEAFCVSRMTIRRDLDWLAERGVVRRVHGGAVSHGARLDTLYGERWDAFAGEKQLIGQTASLLVRDGEQIILDSGTTTLQLARGLNDRRGVTAVTNSLPVADPLCQCRHVSTILLGGMLKRRELCTVGPPVTKELSQLTVDRAFFSAVGFDAGKGVTEADLREAEVKQAMMQAASEAVLVADSSKWCVTALAQIAPLSSFRVVVTDDGVPSEAIEAIEAAGVAVLTPGRAARLPLDTLGVLCYFPTESMQGLAGEVSAHCAKGSPRGERRCD